ncbi:MAG: non-canonical purine NTP pyrophosphatase, partial [Pseudomonadota bacterium]
LHGVDDRRAHFYSVIVLVRSADDPQPLIADGEWHGEIVAQARGDGGFGYDPHFFVPSLEQTAAELAPELKNTLSHRAAAMRHLLDRLKTPS